VRVLALFRLLLLRPPVLRPPLEERALDFREALRPVLRREDLRALPRRDDLRALPALRLLERLLPPRLFRPDDPARALFLPPLERLDFLAAAIGMLREARFVERIARFEHNKAARHRIWFADVRVHVWTLGDYPRLSMLHDPEVVVFQTRSSP